MKAGWAPLRSASAAADEPPALYGHSLSTVTVYGDPLLVAFGGTSAEGVNTQVNSVWTWQHETGWKLATTHGDVPESRGWHGAAVHGSQVYVFGGNRWVPGRIPGATAIRQVFNDMWVLDTANWTWRQVHPVRPDAEWPSARNAVRLVWHDDCLLMFGGKAGPQEYNAYLAELWCFQPRLGTWANVTQDKRKRGPLARALPAFVSTPVGCFMYGGTGGGRVPLCDLWRLEYQGCDPTTGSPSYGWVDCNKTPTCSLQFLAHERSASKAALAEQHPVGHEGHAFTVTNKTRLVVWGGLVGRIPKRTMLASMPLHAHLLGHVFMIDLAAVHLGWDSLPASAILANPGMDAQAPRKWAAMTELAPGRLVVHGGYAEKEVFSRASVLALEDQGQPGGPASAAASTAGRDLISFADSEPSMSSTQPQVSSSGTSSTTTDRSGALGSPGPPTQAAPFPDTPSAAVDAAAATPLLAPNTGMQSSAVTSPASSLRESSVAASAAIKNTSSTVISAMFGQWRKGMEVLSSEAANALQRVQNVALPKGPSSPGAVTDSPQEGRIKYSGAPALPLPPLPDALASSTAAASAGAGVATTIAAWLQQYASCASSEHIRVLVPTSDRLATPQQPLPAQPAHSASASGPTQAAPDTHALPVHAPAAIATAVPIGSSDAEGTIDEPDAHGSSGPDCSSAGTESKRTDGKAAEAATEQEPESPVSVWISPGSLPPQESCTASANPSVTLAAAPSCGDVMPEASRAAHCNSVEAQRVADVQDVLDGLVSFVEQHSQVDLGKHLASMTEPAGETVGFQMVQPDGRPGQSSQRRQRNAEEGGPSSRGGPARAHELLDGDGDAAQGASPGLHTAYVQDMLRTDPVTDLGMRTLGVKQATLEFVSLDEAQVELRAQACAWLVNVPSAECLRCKDVSALLVEYRRAAPFGMVLVGMRPAQRLGTLAHLMADQVRLKDVDRILREYKALRALQGQPGRQARQQP